MAFLLPCLCKYLHACKARSTLGQDPDRARLVSMERRRTGRLPLKAKQLKNQAKHAASTLIYPSVFFIALVNSKGCRLSGQVLALRSCLAVARPRRERAPAASARQSWPTLPHVRSYLASMMRGLIGLACSAGWQHFDVGKRTHAPPEADLAYILGRAGPTICALCVILQARQY